MTDQALIPEGIRKVAECFCGCGEPELAWDWVAEYLEERDLGLYDHKDSGSEVISVYLLAHLGLTEHGFNIAGAWLTKEGKEALEFLRVNGTDWQDTGRWIDSTGCSWGQ